MAIDVEKLHSLINVDNPEADGIRKVNLKKRAMMLDGLSEEDRIGRAHKPQGRQSTTLATNTEKPPPEGMFYPSG